ncbi:ATP-binding protein [Kiloniella sp.]|uniref:ATP-binding protein n=1 Tax=Kiloniella sp. TaxID=1938587 RepID=UPI003A94EEB2
MNNPMKILTISQLGKYLLFFLALSVVITLIHNWTLIRDINDLDSSWNKNESSIVQKQAYLSTLRGTIGYGGMIHNFKNYLLRHDKKYLLTSHRSMLEAKIIISAYRLMNISKEEETALNNIEQMLREYLSAITHAELLINSGQSISLVDDQVAVDDTPAINSLLILTETLATQRQNKTTYVSDEINSLTNHITFSTFLTGGSFILIIVLLVWFLRYRLLLPLATMTSRIREINPKAPGINRLEITGRSKDELGLFIDAVNQFIDSLDTHLVERQNAEKALEISKIEADEANVAKSNFLATMSHEIRTPLNGVLGLAQLLQDTDLNRDQSNKVTTILSSGQTLLAIINDVLDMSKIEAGGLELEEHPFSLSTLVSTITTPFQSLADEKGLELAVHSDGDSDLVLKGDAVRLRQILWNLLSNAIKFTDQGRVSLDIEVISDKEKMQNIVPVPKDYLLYFTVKDTGIGIAPDRCDAIFDAFTQEDNTITRKYGGTGLGLSIVKQISELMGGTIKAKNNRGEGTKFITSIPFQAATEEEISQVLLRAQNNEQPDLPPLNIILAEDNAVNALIAKTFLTKFGHSVRHVENGLLAVDAAKDNWADLILMDIHMPEMNGINATKTILKTEIGKDLPIIGLTAEAFADRHIEFMKAGMVDVLTKPFTEQQLADTLTKNHPVERRRNNRDKIVNS